MEQMERAKTLSLPVKLTEEEVAVRAQELAAGGVALQEAEDAEARYAEEVKAEKKRLERETTNARHQVRVLSTVVRERREDRDVEVEERLDYDANVVHVVRLDTGEIVTGRTRGMNPEERQRALFEKQKGEKAKRAGEARA